jgi:hypothetical protein
MTSELWVLVALQIGSLVVLAVMINRLSQMVRSLSDRVDMLGGSVSRIQVNLPGGDSRIERARRILQKLQSTAAPAGPPRQSGAPGLR